MTAPSSAARVSDLEFSVLKEVEKREPGVFVIGKGKKAEINASLPGGEAKLKIILEENASLMMKSEVRNSSSLMVDCMLSGAGSTVSITNICNCEKSDVQKSVTNIIHSAPKTRSIVNSKGVAWGSSSIELSGLAKIEKSAPGSFSRVECKALVLGEKAKARADPILEILNNDVDCSHAASVREIEKEKVFYLQTRGLNEEEAKKMIVEGFLGSTD